MSVVKGCIHSQDPQSSIPLEILLEKKRSSPKAFFPCAVCHTGFLSSPSFPASFFLEASGTKGIRGGLCLA